MTSDTKFCLCCGSPWIQSLNKETMTCTRCGHKVDAEAMGPDEEAILSDAVKCRNNGQYEDAENRYRDILESNPNSVEAMWGILLCKYGVVYVEREDGNHTDYTITCRKRLKSEFMQEKMLSTIYNKLSYDQKSQYEKDARMISEIQEQIREMDSDNTQYDVFICYKETIPETKAGGIAGRTSDSYTAEHIYHSLRKEGYRVFFAKETLKGMIGAKYEAVIFHAIESARVMLVLGSEEEYFTSLWVKSEWTRFLDATRSDSRKVLFPLFRKIRAEQLPKEFSGFQASNIEEDLRKGYPNLKDNLRKLLRTEENNFGGNSTEADNKARTNEVSESRSIAAIREMLDLGIMPPDLKGAADGTAEGSVEAIKRQYENAANKGKGNAEACYLLACLLLQNTQAGETNRTEKAEALRWLEKAAKQGHADACYQLGLMYELGEGMQNADPGKAKDWYRCAEKLGYPAIVSDF